MHRTTQSRWGRADLSWRGCPRRARQVFPTSREMFGKLDDMVTGITMLLVAVAIKNILFPILFLLGAVKCSLPMARHASRLLSGFERDSRKLKGMMKQLKSPARQLERHGSQR